MAEHPFAAIVKPMISAAAAVLILWKMTHGAYPDVTDENALEACRLMWKAAGGTEYIGNAAIDWQVSLEAALRSQDEPWFKERAAQLQQAKDAAEREEGS